MGNIPVISIDTAVPIPEGNTKYPLATLQVGESFLVPLSKRSSVQARATRVGQATDKSFTVKKMDENNVRVWRTK